MTWDDSYMERAVAWDREHYGPFLPLPGALIKSVIPLSEEENALLADLYVSDFRIKTAEAFILEGLWVLVSVLSDLARSRRSELTSALPVEPHETVQ